MTDVAPWQLVTNEELADCRIFRLLAQRRRSPQTGNVHRFFVLDSPDWINIIPLTADDHVVMVRQFRHGDSSITLEIPGGMVDPGELPQTSAERELREETGFVAETVTPLGVVAPNPAILNNRCHSFLATNVQPLLDQQLDGSEEIDVVLVPLNDIPSLIAAGEITHALTISAFFHLQNRERAQ